MKSNGSIKGIVSWKSFPDYLFKSYTVFGRSLRRQISFRVEAISLSVDPFTTIHDLAHLFSLCVSASLQMVSAELVHGGKNAQNLINSCLAWYIVLIYVR
jgi:hypothetical protein